MPRPTPSGPSTTYDNMSHDSSPVGPATPQTPAPTPAAPKTGMRKITGSMKNYSMPDHVTKHPNPVGRPKNPRP